MPVLTTSPKGPKVLLVHKLPVSDLIRAAAKTDPLRADPEAKRLLDMPWEEYDQYMTELEEVPKED